MRYILLLFFSFGFLTAWAEEPFDEVGALEMFAGDIASPFAESGPYRGDYRLYIDPPAIPARAATDLQALKAGSTRETCVNWIRNGGLMAINEFYWKGALSGRDIVAVRIAFRPADMPLDVYNDPDKRVAWIRDRKPPERLTDVIMKVSKPFLSNLAID